MDEQADLIAMTAGIVSAYVGANSVHASDVPGLISVVHKALGALGGAAEPLPGAAREPAVSVKRSITPDYLICLEDGRRFKSLKRHLRTQYDLSPEDYRAKWGLPRDYPMVAPNYAEARSNLAKQMGLGQGGRKAAGKSAAG
jgi:predicted transcriptional regulator